MRLEWDRTKAVANLRKHGVSFGEASTVFSDPLSVSGPDPDHSLGEHREVIFGLASSGRLLAVGHTERGDSIRIYTARVATPNERQIYEEG